MIPREFGQLATGLTHLNLSYSRFSGPVPLEISHLSKLVSLDLSYNYNLILNDSNTEFQHQFLKFLLQNLTQLRHLSLADVPIDSVLPRNLSSFYSLTFLDLSGTGLHGKLPHEVFFLPNLKTLNLGSNPKVTEVLPQSNLSASNGSSLTSLRALDLSYNTMLLSEVADIVGSLKSLKSLKLTYCNLSGVIPKFIFNLTHLTELDLSLNNLEGQIPNGNLVHLRSLSLRDNKWIGPFPSWVANLSQLVYLDLSYSSIPSTNHFQGTIPSTFANLNNLRYLNLQGNQFEGMVPSLGNCTYLRSIDLRSNKLKDTFPRWMETLPELKFLILRSNKFYGPISISNISKTKNLQVMDLSNNEFRGEIPNVLGTFQFLEDLDLYNNHLQGVVPSSLANCAKLEVLNLGKNQINDTFPNWLGVLPELHVLVLSFNRFHGPISTNYKNKNPFPKLRIIDLSCNEFTGRLPELFFKNFRAMEYVDENKKEIEYVGRTGYYQSSVVLVMKGVTIEIERILTILTTIDLSSNKFKGEIPDVIGNLKFLRQLNLSHNNLVGCIPPLLGNLSVLESLDLNSNQLVGEIPQELANLNSLETLNLSHNHLSGRIPSGKQFNTFLNDSYYGNLALCGFPLSDCKKGEILQLSVLQEENDSDFMGGFTWEAVLMGYGCGTVLGFVIGYIMFLVGKPKWFTRIVERELRRRVKSSQRRGYKHRGGRRN